MDNRYSHSTAADLARMTGYHRTTIVEWIRAGKVGAWGKATKSPNCHYKIYDKEFRPRNVERLKGGKPYPKHSKTYSNAEMYIMRNCAQLPARVVARMIGRSANAVRVKRCLMRKQGEIPAVGRTVTAARGPSPPAVPAQAGCGRTDCKYHGRNGIGCNFLYWTFQRRGCPAGNECLRYTPLAVGEVRGFRSKAR